MVKILSLREANKNRYAFTHCVSISDLDTTEHVLFDHGEIFKLNFDDTEDRSKFSSPKYHHVEEVGKYFKKYIAEDDGSRKLLVHCWAGISRSSAIAIMYLLMSNGYDVKKALEHVDNVRSMASPNGLLIEYIDKYLMLNKELIKAVEKRELKFTTGMFNSPKFKNIDIE